LIDPLTQECLAVHPVEVQLLPQHFLIRFKEFNAPEPLQRHYTWNLAFVARRGELPRATDEIYFFELLGMDGRPTLAPEQPVWQLHLLAMSIGAGMALLAPGEFGARQVARLLASSR